MLPYTFALLRFWGVWPSTDSLSSGWKFFFYNIYTIFMITILYTNIVSQVIDLFVTYENLKQFINNAFILLSTIGAGVKVAHLLWNRKTIIDLMKIIEKDPCCPQDVNEEIIQRKFNRKIKLVYVCFLF